ncbi:MAG: DUF3108 domain-containing protein [Chitinophagia bacterium]|nr:DUF3108 domain-containing protein [Chitinophagia bacterium]
MNVQTIKSLIPGAVFLLTLMGTAGAPLRAQTDFCTPKNSSFNEGERVTFRVYYNKSFIWINSGNAEFTVKADDFNKKKVYHITGIGRTARSFEWFYKVFDTYESYVDKETMLPLHFVRRVNEGGLKINNDVYFNHKSSQAVSDNKTYTIPACTQDVLSAIYFARNIDYSKYKAGDKIPFTMFLDNQVYDLYIKYYGKEQITTKTGTYNVLKIVPLLIEGTIFKGGEKMTVWVSDDANHIPVRIESPILIGSIKVDLVDYENLRSPFTALVSRK